MGMPRDLAKRFLRLLGKSDRKIVALFATSQDAYRHAVEYIRQGTGLIPIWLVTSHPVDEETAAHCERVLEFPHDMRLPLRAAKALWPNWVALNVVPFTRERGFTWLKIAPLLVPPWRILVMNEHGDFFSAWPTGLLKHAMRRSRDRQANWAARAKDVILGVFWKIAWTLLDLALERTSAPWSRRPECPPLAPPETARRKPGILVWIANRALHRRQLLAALDKLGLPYEIVSGETPAGTTYQYVLGVEEDVDGDLREPLQLLERPGAFAASLQAGRAGFQKDILPRAPFRRLQPGEVTAVVAPIPGAVFIDAAKLAQLGGFPTARSRRCRWLLLFWKAAAAGWKSYGVGGHRPRVPMVPDRAFGEAEFCFRLLREEPRSHPAPASFDALRGSVSFHPRHEGPLREDRRRILVVSPYLPFPLSHGGAVRMFYLARSLARRWDLVLLTFREREDNVDYARLSSVFSRVIVVDQDERRKKDTSVPGEVAQYRSRAMTAAIRDAADHYRPDLLQIEFTALAAYREAAPELPAVLVEHDVTFSLYEQLASSSHCTETDRRAARTEFERWYRFESDWLRRYDAVAVMSGEEKSKAVRAGAEADSVWVVPNGVDTERFRPSEAALDEPVELLFVGSFRHLPNILGFEYLTKQILPPLWKDFPELRVRIVAGPDHERHWRRFSREPLDRDARVAIEGFVENLAPYYARAQIVVVPLIVSAGTNIKVTEALACGKPVVSTPIGCVGLGLVEDEEILVAADAEGFRAALKRLLENPALGRHVGQQGRRAAVERYSWESCADQAAEMYEWLLVTAPARLPVSTS